LDGQIDLLTELERNNQVKLVTATTPLIERLDFGIRPASYDDGYAPGIGDRQDILGMSAPARGLRTVLTAKQSSVPFLEGCRRFQTRSYRHHILYSMPKRQNIRLM